MEALKASAFSGGTWWTAAEVDKSGQRVSEKHRPPVLQSLVLHPLARILLQASGFGVSSSVERQILACIRASRFDFSGRPGKLASRWKS